MTHSLTKKKIEIGLSDPWEMGEELGWRSLLGEVYRVGQIGQSKSAVIVQLEEPLIYRNFSGEYLLVSARHQNSDICALNTGETIPVSLTMLSKQIAKSKDAFSHNNWEHKMNAIGGMRLTV